jgi:hypothetical protein
LLKAVAVLVCTHGSAAVSIVSINSSAELQAALAATLAAAAAAATTVSYCTNDHYQ